MDRERTVSEPRADSEWSVSGPWVNCECENSRNWAINKVFKILQKTEERKSYWLIYLHTAGYKRVIRDDKFFRRHSVRKDVTDWHTFCVTLRIWTMATGVSNDATAFETHVTTHSVTSRKPCIGHLFVFNSFWVIRVWTNNSRSILARTYVQWVLMLCAYMNFQQSTSWLSCANMETPSKGET